MKVNRLFLHISVFLAIPIVGCELLDWKAAAQYRPFLELRIKQSGQAPNANLSQKQEFASNYPLSSLWQGSAHSALQAPFGQLSQEPGIENPLPTVAASPIQPQATSHYPAEFPAAPKPFLTWTKVAGAVYYEWELLIAPPETEDITPSQYRLFATREVFANGYHANLSMYAACPLYWRVRALDFDGDPIGKFSLAEKIFIDHRKIEQIAPKPTARYDSMPTPLYPVYYWLPVNGAAMYEVEITKEAPENPGGTTSSVHRISSKIATGYGYYDDAARSEPGTYYWRVRALDANSDAIGVYSDAVPFTVEREQGRIASLFGDSITHGGGAVSYSPADAEYSIQTYLEFPVANLGRSGDTSETMLERFERDVLPYQPRNLLILGGTNSLRGGIPATQVINELLAIRQKCLTNDIRPIFLTLPPINPSAIEKVFKEPTSPHWRRKFDLVNKFIRQQQYFIDLEPSFLDTNRELPEIYGIDGLHLDIEGKKLIAKIINHHWPKVAR